MENVRIKRLNFFLVFSSWVWETKLLIVLQIECNVRNCVGRLSEALCVRKRDASLAGFWSWQFKGEFKFRCPSTKSACAIHDLEVFVSAWSAGSYFKRNFPCNSYPELQYISSSAITSNFSRAPSFHLRTRQCGCGHVCGRVCVGMCVWTCVCVICWLPVSWIGKRSVHIAFRILLLANEAKTHYKWL